VVREDVASALLDGGNGFGAVVTTRATELAIEKARNAGVAAVAARCINHFGAAAYYAMMASEEGVVGIVMGNTTAAMPAAGGTTPVVGNNPIAFAFRSTGAPVVFDAVTSRSSWGALLQAKQAGASLAPGAFLGPDGVPTTDPDAVLAGGSLQPIEGYKGFGLAICIALLTGVLADGAYDDEIIHPYRHLAAPGDNSVLVLAIDVDHFADRDRFAERVGVVGERVRGGRSAPDAPPIMMPGDREHARTARQDTHVELAPETVAELEALGRSLGLDGPALGEPA
jgi:L-2-hydroxycarboxylate dehydrogenase (NAD+)